MTELNFPSGPWKGFYNYGSGTGKHRMDLNLTFSNGRISGDGTDDVGRFLITGTYDASSGECHWMKTYVGAHGVSYRGFREDDGIWGTWEIGGWTGGFHIWPLGEEEGERASVAAQETLQIGTHALQPVLGTDIRGMQ